jgi:glycosyltransferase involved in cell wall biosynthesis
MNDNPLVSIVIPTYNQQESFLREAIESAIGQTYKNIEVLISDNHCNNGSSEIMAEYALTDKRIRIIKPDRFLSLMDNFSFAYENARGEYICPLSSDDILYPEIVATLLVPYKTYPNLSFSYSMPFHFIDKLDKQKWKPRKFKTGFYDSSSYLRFYITKEHGMFWGGILIKKSNFFTIGGFSKEINFLADNDCLIKLILLGGGVYYINEPLSAIRSWEREEQTDRIPYGLMDCGKTYNYLENAVTLHKQALTSAEVRKKRKKIFLHEALPIPYLFFFKKRKLETINKTIDVIRYNYPNSRSFNFVLNNRNNFLGLLVSSVYLAIMKVKNIFK